MKKIYYLLFNICCLLVTAACFAQDTANEEAPQMADGLRSSGKIYVVVAVVLAILAGVVIYLVQLDKKINRLEKAAGVRDTDSRTETRTTSIGSRESGVKSN
jgi:hypothetical protein